MSCFSKQIIYCQISMYIISFEKLLEPRRFANNNFLRRHVQNMFIIKCINKFKNVYQTRLEDLCLNFSVWCQYEIKCITFVILAFSESYEFSKNTKFRWKIKRYEINNISKFFFWIFFGKKIGFNCCLDLKIHQRLRQNHILLFAVQNLCGFGFLFYTKCFLALLSRNEMKAQPSDHSDLLLLIAFEKNILVNALFMFNSAV